MKFRKTLDIYLGKLDGYSEEQFLQQPDENSWSIGQVYVHAVLANDHFFLKQAVRCLDKEDTHQGKGKNNRGRVIFLINGFPNIKFKMPRSAAVTPRQPESIDSNRKKLKRSLDLAQTVEDRLDGFDKNEKTRHPAFGHLNAKEWYRMSEIHFRHHLRQIKRIESSLGI